jgi:hypothetical protein
MVQYAKSGKEEKKHKAKEKEKDSKAGSGSGSSSSSSSASSKLLDALDEASGKAALDDKEDADKDEFARSLYELDVLNRSPSMPSLLLLIDHLHEQFGRTWTHDEAPVWMKQLLAKLTAPDKEVHVNVKWYLQTHATRAHPICSALIGVTSVLCCAVLCCAVLCCAVLCCGVVQVHR